MVEPAFAFPLPSLQDDVALETRLYHPNTLSADGSLIKGAVLAHPYGPLGGSYDDPVVLSTVETLLTQGYVVVTFNFRGAGGSEGGTSWTGRAETEDYATITGFTVYYLHYLASTHYDNPDSEGEKPRLQLLLGGYSYGSLVLARLPEPSTIIQRFENATVGSSAAETVLRARTLAKQTMQALQEAHSPARTRGRSLKPDDATTSPTQRARASPVIIGGDESDPSERRRSRDSRRSADIVRKSVELPRRVRAQIVRRYSGQHRQKVTPSNESERPSSHGDCGAPDVSVHYLLISPVVLPLTNTLCPPGPPSFALGLRKPPVDGTAGSRFLSRPTLVVFGNQDAFTACRRLRAWAERQTQDSHHQDFEGKQIDGAGHFWREDGVMKAMQQHIANWIKDLR